MTCDVTNEQVKEDICHFVYQYVINVSTYFISNTYNVLKITNMKTATGFAIRSVCTLLKAVEFCRLSNEAVHGMNH